MFLYRCCFHPSGQDALALVVFVVWENVGSFLNLIFNEMKYFIEYLSLFTFKGNNEF